MLQEGVEKSLQIDSPYFAPLSKLSPQKLQDFFSQVTRHFHPLLHKSSEGKFTLRFAVKGIGGGGSSSKVAPYSSEHLSTQSPLPMSFSPVLSQEAPFDPSLYVPLCTKTHWNAEEILDLEKEVKAFLASDQLVLLLHGNSGSGKTLFCHYLQSKLSEYQVLYLSLPQLKNSPHLFEETVLQNGLKNLLQGQKPLLLLLDAYDEAFYKSNLFKLSQLDKYPLKMLITCRSEYLQDLDCYPDYFIPYKEGKAKRELLRELFIPPFQKEQISLYIQKYTQSHPLKGWEEGKRYQEEIARIPRLSSLVTTPFILHITLEVLPSILAKQPLGKDLKITRFALYEAFLEAWFTRRAAKVGLPKEPLIAQHKDFSQKLAAAMHQQGVFQITYNSADALFGEESQWEQFFSSEKQQLRAGCPLKAIGKDTYTFIHKTVQDFLVSKELFEKQAWEQEESFSQEKYTRLTQKLNLRPCSKDLSLLVFFIDLLEQQASLKDLLLHIIERSKKDKAVATAAANSITILSEAHVPLSHRDFRGIAIPGADLSLAILDRSDLSKSDLREVDLRQASLYHTRLENSLMEKVDFGKQPYIKHPDCYGPVRFITKNGKDFSHLLLGFHENDLYLWDTTINQARTLPLPDLSSLWQGYLSPDGRYVALTYWDNTVWVGEILQEPFAVKMVRTYPHTSFIFHAALFSDKEKTYLILSNTNNEVSLKEIEQNTSFSLGEFPELITSSAFYPPSLLALGDQAGVIFLREITLGKETLSTLTEYTLSHHAREIRNLAFSPDGLYLASTNSDCAFYLWEVKKGKEPTIMSQHTDFASSLVFSPTGRYLASALADYTVRLWECQGGIVKEKELLTLSGHSQSVNSIAFSPDERYLVSKSSDETIHLWTLEEEELLSLQNKNRAKEPLSLTSAFFAPDNLQIALLSTKGHIYLSTLQPDNSLLGKELELLSPSEEIIHTLAFSPDGKYLAAAKQSGVVDFWDLTSKKFHPLFGHEDSVTCVAFSPAGNLLASGSDDKTARLWEIRTGKEYAVLRSHNLAVTKLLFSPNGSYLALGSWDQVMLPSEIRALTEILSGGAFQVLSGKAPPLSPTIFTPQEEEARVRLWQIDSSSPHELQTLNKKTSTLHALAFSPTSRLLACSHTTGAYLGEISHPPVHSLPDLTEESHCIAFSPDENFLAAGSQSGALHLWQIEHKDPTQLRNHKLLSGHTAKINDSHFLRQAISLQEAMTTHCAYGRSPPEKKSFF